MEDIDKRIGELEEMIDLAEKVSTNIRNINRRHNIIIVVSFLLTCILIVIGVVISMWLFDKSFTLSYILIGFFVMFLAAVIRNEKERKEEVNTESEVLRKLLNTIFPYKASIFRGTHNMKMKEAIINMRLSRLKFTYKVDVNEKIKDNEIIPIENIPIPQPKEPATTP